MVNLELMSDNLTLILKEVIGIQNVVKYLSYTDKSPLSQPDIILPANNLILSRVHPYPFDPISHTEDTSEIRIYYPEGFFDNSGAVAGTCIYIDIVVAKSLWLINDGKSAVRPYMIMSELHKHFSKNSIGTLGRINFVNFAHLHINEKFDAIRVEADMVLFGG